MLSNIRRYFLRNFQIVKIWDEKMKEQTDKRRQQEILILTKGKNSWHQQKITKIIPGLSAKEVSQTGSDKFAFIFNLNQGKSLKMSLNGADFANYQLFFSYQIPKTMFPLNQMQYAYVNLFLLSQLLNNQGNPYQQNRDNAQLEGQNIKTSDPKTPFQQTDSKISDERLQKTQKTETKSSLVEIDEKKSTQHSKLQNNNKFDGEKQKIKEPTKPKRPQNYLTERAFYMKQKLKSKQRADKRILRRRPKEKVKSSIKVSLRSVEQKKKIEVSKKSPKNKIIKKQSNPQKEKKNYLKVQEKIIKQYTDSAAKIPKKMIGIWKINEFCRIKYESLMKRRVILRQ